MTATRLTLFFSGTDMVWEDMAIFLQMGATKRHNLEEKSAHHYYIFDGPAAATNEEHKPTESLTFSKEQKDFTEASDRQMKNKLGYLLRWARGQGTNNIAEVAYQIILNSILENKITKIDLCGFSRGGNIALIVGSLLKQLTIDLKDQLSPKEIEAINIRIYVIDPVAGKSKNWEAHQYGVLSAFVKECYVGLATNESVPFFHPRDPLSMTPRYRIQFHKDTRFVILPFPDDHLMCLLWMKDLIRATFPLNSPLLLSSNDDAMIASRIADNWDDRIDHTRAFRAIYYVKNKAKFTRSILFDNGKEPTLQLQNGINEFFKYIESQRSKVNIGHVSLQNEADSETKDRTYKGKMISGLRLNTQKTQAKFALKNHSRFYRAVLNCHDRTCKEQIERYTNDFFVNLLHEAMFAMVYPNLHLFLQRRGKEMLESAMAEFQAILLDDKYPDTQKQVEKILISGKKLRPLESFESTNIKEFKEMMRLIIPTDFKPGKQKEHKEFKEAPSCSPSAR